MPKTPKTANPPKGNQSWGFTTCINLSSRSGEDRRSSAEERKILRFFSDIHYLCLYAKPKLLIITLKGNREKLIFIAFWLLTFAITSLDMA